MRLTYEPELLGVLKALPVSNEEHSGIDARVKAGLYVKSLAIPGVRVGVMQGWISKNFTVTKPTDFCKISVGF